MDRNEGMKQLNEMFKDRDWFYDVGTDQYGRIVVYVKYMNHETLHDVPDYAGGIQVLVHFAGSKTSTREQFVNMPQAPGASLKLPMTPTAFIQSAREAQAKGIDIGFLQTELARLEKKYGSYIPPGYLL